MEMRETVRGVHRAAAQWYRSGGASDPNANARAAYHDAFLGEITALVSDPSLVRRVLDVAGEDVSAMPVEARAVLRREARSDEALSVEEVAALPVEQRREVDATRQSRRAKSGVTSRHLDDGDEVESVPADASGVASRPFAESGISTRRYRGDQIHLLEDKETAQRIEAMFVEADFNGIVSFGADVAAQLCETAQEEPPFDRLGDTTSHWTWKWALSCLATGAGDEAFLRWAVDSHSENVLSNNDPFRIGTLLSLAIATVALGRAPSFKNEPPYQNAVMTYPVIESAPATSILSLRLRALVNYWDEARVLKPPRALEVQPGVVQLVALWSFHQRLAVFNSGVPASIFKMPEELERRLSSFQLRPPLSSDLKLLDEGESISFPSGGPNSSPLQSEPPMVTRRALGLLLRGRSPELYDPVRAALGDALAANGSSFAAAVAEISQLAPFWPKDCMSDLYSKNRNNLREEDYLLARLVVFLDLAGLTSMLFSALTRREKSSRRFQAVAKLIHTYDALLLAPYDDVAMRSEDGSFSGNAM
jgi:hypothetical protein